MHFCIMKNIIILIFSLSVFLITSCNNKKQVKARIIERKEEGNNRIRIKYRYLVDGISQTDSAIVDNTVINRDTITVSYFSKRPDKSIPDLEK